MTQLKRLEAVQRDVESHPKKEFQKKSRGFGRYTVAKFRDDDTNSVELGPHSK
jgi:hypothetical protein